VPLTDQQKARWANSIIQDCIEEAEGDLDAALSAASILVDVLPLPDDYVDDRTEMEAMLSTLDAGLSAMGARNAALAILNDQEAAPRTIGELLYGHKR